MATSGVGGATSGVGGAIYTMLWSASHGTMSVLHLSTPGLVGFLLSTMNDQGSALRIGFCCGSDNVVMSYLMTCLVTTIGPRGSHVRHSPCTDLVCVHPR